MAWGVSCGRCANLAPHAATSSGKFRRGRPGKAAPTWMTTPAAIAGRAGGRRQRCSKTRANAALRLQRSASPHCGFARRPVKVVEGSTFSQRVARARRRPGPRPGLVCLHRSTHFGSKKLKLRPTDPNYSGAGSFRIKQTKAYYSRRCLCCHNPVVPLPLSEVAEVIGDE